MLFELLATWCAGLFAGAAIYITFVEHPARLECGTELAATEFGPSYRRATLMQASEYRDVKERFPCRMQRVTRRAIPT